MQGIGAGNIPTSNSSESRGSNTGVIVGTIIGLLLALLLLGVVIVVIVLFLVRRRQNSMPAKYSTKTETDGDIGLGKHPPELLYSSMHNSVSHHFLDVVSCLHIFPHYEAIFGNEYAILPNHFRCR